MKKNLKNWILVPLLMIFLHVGVGELPAQNGAKAAKEGDELKKLIMQKFDQNRDGNLVGAEKTRAVEFLKGLDMNGDGQISLTERTKAAMELKKMPDPTGKVEKMTVENRNKTKRKSSWGEFVRSLPHGGGSRTFTTMPGSPGFDIKGEKDIDLAADSRKGPAPNIPTRTVEEVRAELKIKREKEAFERKRQGMIAARAASKGVVTKVEKGKKKGYYDGTVILANGGVHAVVPEGAILNMPPKLTKMVVKEPEGDLMGWRDFLKKNSTSISTREVSWKTITGEDPITEKEQKNFTLAKKIVVAVFNKNPVTVLEPQPESDDETVSGAVASDGSKKK